LTHNSDYNQTKTVTISSYESLVSVSSMVS